MELQVALEEVLMEIMRLLDLQVLVVRDLLVQMECSHLMVVTEHLP